MKSLTLRTGIVNTIANSSSSRKSEYTPRTLPKAASRPARPVFISSPAPRRASRLAVAA